MTKLTSKVALSYAVAILTNAEVNKDFTSEQIVEKLNSMIAQLDKKSGSEKKLTEQQVQNIGFKTDILALLSDGKARTATEILNEVPNFEGTTMTNQRVSALLRQLILDNKVIKDIVKGKAFFKIAEGV